MRFKHGCTALAAMLLLAGCGKQQEAPMFLDDVQFLEKYTRVIVLQDGSGEARIAVCPEYQGRIMTSTAGGPRGSSYGWIHRKFIESGRKDPKMNAYGGEDRFWLGPEGGQFSVFFKKDSPFDFEHWSTPAPIDTEPYGVTAEASDSVKVGKAMSLTNYSGTRFDLTLERTLRLLDPAETLRAMGVDAPGPVKAVAFQSQNRITNTGENRWKRDTGLVSIWILGMFNPSPGITVVVPFREDPEAKLGPVVKDDYFGKVPADRLILKDGVIFFRCDGEFRSKIGVSPMRCKPVVGSWDAKNRVLTLVTYTVPEGPRPYVNSMWEMQKDPYSGDAVNSYNDGPPSPGAAPMGPFYELETSSPAAELGPGESLVHLHRTVHLQGDREVLDRIAWSTLGAGLDRIEAVFKIR